MKRKPFCWGIPFLTGVLACLPPVLAAVTGAFAADTGANTTSMATESAAVQSDTHGAGKASPNKAKAPKKSPPMILLNKEAVLAAWGAGTEETAADKPAPATEPVGENPPMPDTPQKEKDNTLPIQSDLIGNILPESDGQNNETGAGEVTASVPASPADTVQAGDRTETNSPADQSAPKKRVTITAAKDKTPPVPLHTGMRLFDRLNPFQGETKETGYWDLAWHARLADYGDTESQYIVARAYETGHHTAKNKKKALYFYKTAAQSGHAESANRLGQIFEHGLLGETNMDQALFWYDLAGKQDFVPALLAASELCRKGDNADYEKSYTYLKHAMTILFPEVTDLESVSPELADLKKQIIPFKINKAINRINRAAESVANRRAAFLKTAGAALATADKMMSHITESAAATAPVVPGVEVLTPAGLRPVYQAGEDPIQFLTQRLIDMHRVQEGDL